MALKRAKRPATLPESVFELWDTLVERLAEREAWRPELAELVERYCRAVDLAAAAWKKVPRTLSSKGSMNQTVPHWAIGIAQKADADAAKYGAMLGIDLTVRKSAGRPAGAVSAPDRKAAKGGPPAKVTQLRSVGGGKGA